MLKLKKKANKPSATNLVMTPETPVERIISKHRLTQAPHQGRRSPSPRPSPYSRALTRSPPPLYFTNTGPKAGEGERVVKGNGIASSEAGRVVSSPSHPPTATITLSYSTPHIKNIQAG